MNRLMLLMAVLLAVLWLGTPSPAAAQKDAGIVGNWSATVLGQQVTASFTRKDDMIFGVIVIPDMGGTSNTYHVAGVILGAEFAAQHGSGHLLKGTLTGPDTAEAVFTPKSGPSLPLHLTRQPGP
ncbi:hypothetical protein [Desulfovibrio sp. TomC]|uniref:hypothetical protein n=1 Tax=Desulfovibrio sp. TomC TaxID=1562888 RepID=UPI0005BC4F0B|nr:hypothetical protein [Desulfovibrio sp. TomC]